MLIAKVNGTTVESFSFYGTNSSTAGVSISTNDAKFLESISSLPVISSLPYDPTKETLDVVEPYVKNGYVYTVEVKTI